MRDANGCCWQLLSFRNSWDTGLIFDVEACSGVGDLGRALGIMFGSVSGEPKPGTGHVQCHFGNP
jgi:hypothetical protein